MACSPRLYFGARKTSLSPKAHAANVNEMATISPSSNARQRSVALTGCVQKASKPATPTGSDAKKPMSASDGNEGALPKRTVYMVNVASPAHHAAVATAISAHPRRSLPFDAVALQAHAAAATNAAATVAKSTSVILN